MHCVSGTGRTCNYTAHQYRKVMPAVCFHCFCYLYGLVLRITVLSIVLLVLLAVLPPVIEPISDETVLIGGNEAFFCDATGSTDPNVTLEWSRTGESLEDDSSVGSHIRIVMLFRTLLLLSIIDVGVEDAAVYTCTATNSDGVFTAQSVNLTVIGKK